MDSSLLEVLFCPACHGELKAVEGAGVIESLKGALVCAVCGQRFVVEGGMPILGDREFMDKVCDRWPEGLPTPELYRRNIENSREWYSQSPVFAGFIDSVAKARGIIVDIATGPGASFSGALVPRLSSQSHFVMTDAATEMLLGLKAAWGEETHPAKVSFIACDGHQLPFRDGSIDTLTSQSGFDCVNDDPTRSRPPGSGRAYQEGARVLKLGGQVFTTTRIYQRNSETAGLLESLGCDNASGESLEHLWMNIGLDVLSESELQKSKGKSDPGDGLPVNENDEWSVMAYILIKRQ